MGALVRVEPHQQRAALLATEQLGGAARDAERIALLVPGKVLDDKLPGERHARRAAVAFNCSASGARVGGSGDGESGYRLNPAWRLWFFRENNREGATLAQC
uniref:Uncharacterized protein n=1 Tax=uncultured marine group II/III euryarchaeote KM3_15_B02 TaxID=1457910 RepID=A0A075GFF1_9EURY|nr:hypothetical protein [uncultured marine group II/III euryarchaeote KM3_15_B02]